MTGNGGTDSTLPLRAIVDRIVAPAHTGEPASGPELAARYSGRELGKAFRDSLESPQPIEEVERIEAIAVALWKDVIDDRCCSDPEAIMNFGDFFHELGFLYKYKSYGVKIATPFGYSIFDLDEGRGFSFQIHAGSKIEAFHILSVKPGATVYVSSTDEWQATGRDWATQLLVLGEPVPDIPFVLRPSPGDTIEVGTTDIVHSALGCVLEEYATTSFDAVERLLDQNAGEPTTLPSEHRDVSEVLRDCHNGLPIRKLSRVPNDGWHAARANAAAPIIDVDGVLAAGRIPVTPSAEVTVGGVDGHITVVVAAEGAAEVSVPGRSWPIRPGRYACIAPGVAASVRASEACVIAVHQITQRFLFEGH